MSFFLVPRRMLPGSRWLVAGVLISGAMLAVLSDAADVSAQGGPAMPTANPATPPADSAPVVFDEQQVARGLQAYKDGGCRNCHGWAANGEREGEYEEAPSLRQTTLTPEMIRETIQCGRPGTAMPYFDSQAYNWDTRCYGLDRTTIGDLRPPRSEVGFTEEELDDLVIYLQARVIGLDDKPTFEQCQLFNSGRGGSCEYLR